MPQPAPPPDPSGHDQFGTALEPQLHDACGGRLSPIHWFRTDWQRGGAVTGYSEYTDDAGQTHPAVVKLPVPPQELMWYEQLGRSNTLDERTTPQFYIGGRELGGYDLAWVVIERMPHGPLDSRWLGAEFDLLAEAACRFYRATASRPVDIPRKKTDWPDMFKRSREALRKLDLPDKQRWTEAIKTLQKKAKKLLGVWDTRPIDQWCHGDLHLANAMTRAEPPHGPAVLLDLALVHPGHWIEDAVYFEHLYWAIPQRLGGVDVVKLISRHRREFGLTSEPDWPRLADVRRIFVASAAPAQQLDQPQPVYLAAALAKLEEKLKLF